ncbi:MAG TPA: prepilin-type N-terminal cleavage/methylation domain-containing protein [Patescibacteria group bacterium]|nr:prepilin-type N-terminal cleavage/methylation domain-containing protein [Patescibacteria group bacterium]
MKKKSFTFIEFLIVIAVIAIIAAIIFIAVDPIAKFRESRNAKRWTDVNKILNSIKVDRIDNGGAYLPSVENMKAGKIYMITDGSSNDCDNQNDYCASNVAKETASGEYCLNLSGLVSEGYLEELPISPNGKGNWSKSMAGYTLEKSQNGIITIRACESEKTPEIWVAR